MTTSAHGHACGGVISPTYYSWASMIQRCTNPARNVYAIYGGRGIKVCERWSSFENFLADMRPANTSLGRIDGNSNYCLKNCEWQTATKQARTRANNKLSEKTAAEIKRLYSKGDVSQRTLGSKFGVSKTMIRNVVLERAWA